MPATWALTARGADLDRLGAWFSEGVVGGVVLTGPPGVGKTRLAEEALRTAAGHPTARAVDFRTPAGDTVTAVSGGTGPTAFACGSPAVDLVQSRHTINFLNGTNVSYTMNSK